MNRRRWMIVGLVVALVAGAFALGTYVSGRMVEGPDPQPTPTATASPDDPEGAPDAGEATPEEFVEFRNDEQGFAISYPKSWERLESGNPDVALLVTRNRQDSFLVRVVELGFEVDPQDLATMRSVAAEVVQGNEDVQVLVGPDQIELDGLPGYFYLYTFKDEDGEQGIHSHYFLFERDRVITLVFQALPLRNFGSLAPTFDRIAQSFENL